MRFFILAALVGVPALASFTEGPGIDFTTQAGMALTPNDITGTPGSPDGWCYLLYSSAFCPGDMRMPQFEVNAREAYYLGLVAAGILPPGMDTQTTRPASDPSAVPEPASGALVMTALALGALGLRAASPKFKLPA